MTRKVLLAALLVLVGGLLAGCGSSSGSASANTASTDTTAGKTGTTQGATPDPTTKQAVDTGPTDLSYALGDDYCAKALDLSDFSVLGSEPATLVAGTSGDFQDGVGCRWYAGGADDPYPPFKVEADKFTKEEAGSNGARTSGDGWLAAQFSDNWTVQSGDADLGDDGAYLLSKDPADGQLSAMAVFAVKDTYFNVTAEINGPNDPSTGKNLAPTMTADQLRSDLIALSKKMQTNLATYQG